MPMHSSDYYNRLLTLAQQRIEGNKTFQPLPQQSISLRQLVFINSSDLNFARVKPLGADAPLLHSSIKRALLISLVKLEGPF